MFTCIRRLEAHRHVSLWDGEVQHELNRAVFQQRFDRDRYNTKFAGAGFGCSRVEVGANDDLHLLKKTGGSEVGRTDVACTDETNP